MDSRPSKRFSASCPLKRLLQSIAPPASVKFLRPSPFVPTVEKEELLRRPRRNRRPPWNWGSTSEIQQSPAEVGQRKAQPAHPHSKRNFGALRGPYRRGRHSSS